MTQADILERLRTLSITYADPAIDGGLWREAALLKEAANEIERLRRPPSDRDGIRREALQECAGHADRYVEGARAQRRGFLLEGGSESDEAQMSVYKGAIEAGESIGKMIRTRLSALSPPPDLPPEPDKI